jgi:hypothetical protein
MSVLEEAEDMGMKGVKVVEMDHRYVRGILI